MNITIPAQRKIWLETPSGTLLPIGSHCSIGRSKANSIVVACSKVSRRHAILRRDARDRCILMDLGSSNGTYVNGDRVIHFVELKNGDVVQIGSERFSLGIGSDGVDGERELADDPTRQAALVPCWLLVGHDQNGPSAAEEEIADDEEAECFKTVVGWLQSCQRVVIRHQGQIADPCDYKLLAYWPDPGRSPDVLTSIINALRHLHPLQARFGCEFRLALHFGKIVIGEERSHSRKSLSGTEVVFALGMQALAWNLKTACLLSEEAGRRSGASMPAAEIGASPLVRNGTVHRWFTPADW